jgi:hypothetical protein
VNFSLRTPKAKDPLFCWAVSAKRYVLFNVDRQGGPILRKASAHGLGHLRAPYDARSPAKGIPTPTVSLEKLGVKLWQHDLWWKIASAALSGDANHVDLDYHPNLNEPAVSRYAATTPKLLKWYDRWNENLPYDKQVKPFGFLLSFFYDPLSWLARLNDGVSELHSVRALKPVAAYDQNHSRAAKHAFDRDTGEPVPPEALKSFKQVLAQYHLHPESKFLNGAHLDRGVTLRRSVHVAGIRHIGKEANNWERQFYLGFAEEEQIDYGMAPDGSAGLCQLVRGAVDMFGQRTVADAVGMSRVILVKLVRGERVRLSNDLVARIIQAIKSLREHQGDKDAA